MNVINMDCVAGMGLFPDGYFDSVVCDPPYELGFMGKSWDNTGIAYSVPMWREVLRVLKPGGHLLAFSGSRTYHRMTCAIEDAGFEIRDQIMWVYGSGFPKSLDVSKAIDKAAGYWRGQAGDINSANGAMSGGKYARTPKGDPITDAAKQWQGWGTALKPAHEPICVARKPLSAGTVAANVLQHGTGAINIDACRVGSEVRHNRPVGELTEIGSSRTAAKGSEHDVIGRWPANFIHDGGDEVLAGFPKTLPSKASLRGEKSSAGTHDGWARASHAGFDSVRGHNDEGGTAARYFYCAKASKSDRDEGLSGLTQRPSTSYGEFKGTADHAPKGDHNTRANIHPTVKPTNLMRHLVRLVTPPGGTVLDPFTGSGSTGKAAALEGFGFIGFELSAEYAAIAQARIDHAVNLRHTATHDKK